MNQAFGICTLSLVPVRSEASHKSEMSTQLLFGDHFQILERQGDWIRLCTAYDDYEGWVDFRQVLEISKDIYSTIEYSTILGLQLGEARVGDEVMHLVPGSTLPFYNEGVCSVKGTKYKITGLVNNVTQDNLAEDIVRVSRFYLNTPYLWGGKSPFGIDCSGFCQMVFKQFGIRLKRDAWQQVLQGEPVSFLQEAMPGDLAFFDNEEGRIIHVGIMLNNQTIIHASGRVKIDKIDNQGIYSDELSRYTHKLRIIKRYI
jgi:gamma-D-glutamyl-L-lysine dipeptidyl-peptidase